MSPTLKMILAGAIIGAVGVGGYIYYLAPRGDEITSDKKVGRLTCEEEGEFYANCLMENLKSSTLQGVPPIKVVIGSNLTLVRSGDESNCIIGVLGLRNLVDRYYIEHEGKCSIDVERTSTSHEDLRSENEVVDEEAGMTAAHRACVSRIEKYVECTNNFLKKINTLTPNSNDAFGLSFSAVENMVWVSNQSDDACQAILADLISDANSGMGMSSLSGCRP